MNSNLVIIHQPDFFPWLGFFNKLVKGDVFVVLDHVTNHPKARNWLRRVKIIVNGGEHWISVPVIKDPERSFIPIYDMEINDEHENFEKIKTTIAHNYGKAPYFDEAFPLVQNYFSFNSESLEERNLSFISHVMEEMGFPMPPIIRSKDLDCQHQKMELLIEIIEKVNGDSFIVSGGIDEYFEEEKMKNKGINLIDQDFQHPVYSQFNSKEFIPGLSIIDSLMNNGIKGTASLISSTL